MGESNVCAMCPGPYLCLQLSSFPEIPLLHRGKCVPFSCVPSELDLSLKCLLNQPVTAKKPTSYSPSHQYSSATSRVSFLSPALCPSSSLWHTRAFTHGDLPLKPQVTLPRLQASMAPAPHSAPTPPCFCNAVLSDSPHNLHSPHSFT